MGYSFSKVEETKVEEKVEEKAGRIAIYPSYNKRLHTDYPELLWIINLSSFEIKVGTSIIYLWGRIFDQKDAYLALLKTNLKYIFNDNSKIHIITIGPLPCEEEEAIPILKSLEINYYSFNVFLGNNMDELTKFTEAICQDTNSLTKRAQH
jgi:hypothetical protein